MQTVREPRPQEQIWTYHTWTDELGEHHTRTCDHTVSLDRETTTFAPDGTVTTTYWQKVWWSGDEHEATYTETAADEPRLHVQAWRDLAEHTLALWSGAWHPETWTS